MSFQATNTADHILVVEGETNLPAGSPLKAELQTREGRVMLRDSAVVSHGKFFFDFDLKGLNGLNLYQVNVRFDPQTAPLGVRQVTGLWGEALEGPGVKEVSSRRLVEQKIEVILAAGGEGQDWEGRDFADMETSDRARLVAQLEQVIDDRPTDRNAKFALARAYIAGDPRERASGTRAYALLKEVAGGPEGDSLTTQAGKLTQTIEGEETQKQAVNEQRKKIAEGDRFQTETTIWPGRAIGAFSLGATYISVARHLKLDRPPDFSNPDLPGVVQLKKPAGLELRFDSRSRRLIAIRVTSDRFTLPEGFGVGSLLQQLQQAYGKDAVPTPQFRSQETRADGRLISRGVTEASGVEFEILREIDPTFGLPLDKVTAITVFAPPPEATR